MIAFEIELRNANTGDSVQIGTNFLKNIAVENEVIHLEMKNNQQGKSEVIDGNVFDF